MVLDRCHNIDCSYSDRLDNLNALRPLTTLLNLNNPKSSITNSLYLQNHALLEPCPKCNLHMDIFQ
jgi:hypothetical protein